MFNDTVSQKKRLLSSLIKSPLMQLAANCSAVWGSAEELSQTLQRDFCKLPHCQLVYSVDTHGKQNSANISRNQIDSSWYGQDLSSRPYMQGNLPFRGMTLSAAYLSQRSMHPCLTAMQAVRQADSLLGFIAADFHLKDLPQINTSALRRLLSQTQDNQTVTPRATSHLDDHIDYLHYVLTTLLQEHGVFHCHIHFGSSRCQLWSSQSPLSYQLHSVEELMHPDLFICYPKQPYPAANWLDLEKIPLALAQFKALRDCNEHNYLRSASLNLTNKTISLTFNNDGTHYLTVDDFLNRELNYWLGKPSTTEMTSDTTSHKN